MANDIPATEPAPDVGLLMSGQQLDEAVAVLAQASNWAQAFIGSGTPRVLQVFPLRGSSAPGTALVTYTSNSMSVVCEWPVPDTRGVTSVDCYIVAKSSTGAGEVEFRSVVEGGITGAQVIGTTLELHGPFALDIDASGGYEKVRMFLDANGDTISLAAALVVVAPEVALGAGADGMGCVAFDAAELDANEPLAADTGKQLVANLGPMRHVPHVYYSWSAVANTTLSTDGNRMVAWPHIASVPVWPDTERQEWELTIVARVGPTSGGVLKIHACQSAEFPTLDATEINVSSSLSEQYVTGTIRLPARRILRSMPDGWGSVAVMVWPEPTAADAVDQLYEAIGGGDALTDVDIRSLSMWGR